MKVIIAGSRNFTNKEILKDILYESGLDNIEFTEVVSGCALGADVLGEQWAAENNIPVKQFPADWKTHGKAAGPIRNKQMAEYADAAIIFNVNFSKGSTDMFNQMIKLKKTVIVVYFDETQKLIGHTILFTLPKE